jgi:hypothetical protein
MTTDRLISRHKYSEFIVSLSVELYVNFCKGLERTSKMISYLIKKFDLSQSETPCPNSIKNWVLKSGYDIYKEAPDTIKEQEYATITDESMMIGSEKLLVTLGVHANKDACNTLKRSDVTILDIGVKERWNSTSIGKAYDDIVERVGSKPLYVISDNDSKITKAMREKEYINIRDVSHTLALFVEHQFKTEESFINYTKAISSVLARANMKKSAFLLPPRQRTIARFMNLSPTVEWSIKMLKTVDTLPKEEKETFLFIKDHESVINELKEVMELYSVLQNILKTKGLCTETMMLCEEHIVKKLNSKSEKVCRIANDMMVYLLEEVQKKDTVCNHSIWHCSSDIIESIFGTMKARKSSNKLNGVTSSIFMLPVLTKTNVSKGTIEIDFRETMEKVFLKEISSWKDSNLTENLTSKRYKMLKNAG